MSILSAAVRCSFHYYIFLIKKNFFQAFSIKFLSTKPNVLPPVGAKTGLQARERIILYLTPLSALSVGLSDTSGPFSAQTGRRLTEGLGFN